MANYRRDLAKQRFWRDAMRRRERSGLSVREFCSRHGLKESAFYFWRRELIARQRTASLPRGAACEPAAAFLPVTLSAPASSGPMPDGAAAISGPVPDAATATSGCMPHATATSGSMPHAAATSGSMPHAAACGTVPYLEIIGPHGVTLRVSTGCEPEWLRGVLRVLDADWMRRVRGVSEAASC